MRHGSSGDWKLSEMNAKLIYEVGRHLSHEKAISAKLVVLMSVAAAVQREANWQERCWCHEGSFGSPGTFRERLMRYRKDSAGCAWKGRRGSELAAGKWRTQISNIANYRSADLRDLLFDSPPDVRAATLALEAHLKHSVLEQITMKLEVWGKLPLKMFGMFACQQGGSIEDSRQTCKECLAELEVAAAAGNRSRIHRAVYRLFLDSDLPFKQDLESFASGGVDQLSHATLYELRCYAMSPTVTRKTEGAHSRISKFQKASTHMYPANINSQIKKIELATSLELDPAYYKFAVKMWPKRFLGRSLLECTHPPQHRWKARVLGRCNMFKILGARPGQRVQGSRRLVRARPRNGRGQADCISAPEVLPKAHVNGRLYLYNVEDQFRDLQPEQGALE
eukprot:4243722-Pyramimonas_sp.AAC.1